MKVPFEDSVESEEDESSENDYDTPIIEEVNTPVIVTNPYGVNELHYVR